MDLKGSYDYVPEALNNGLKDEEKIKLVLKPLKQGEFFRLASIFDKFRNNGTGKVELKTENMSEFINSCKDVFNNQYVEVKNLTIDGKEVTADEVIDHPRCFNLVCEVTMKIFEISGLGEEEEKNSEGASGIS